MSRTRNTRTSRTTRTNRTIYAMLVASFLLASSLLGSNALAQMYKWVGANGKIVYSDTPPPANAKKLASKSMEASSSLSSIKFPPELQAAVSKNPVTFYSTSSCDACNAARAMLKQNGIPFLEKTIKTNEDIERLKQVTGDTQLPLIFVNKAKFLGFDATEWRTALTAGGYPETSILPKEYRYPEPQSISPAPVNGNKEEAAKPSDTVKPRTASPTGIRF